MSAKPIERFHTVVVGGGQAGLATGYQLTQRGISHVILDGSKNIGDVWRNRWDSLRLFSPNLWNNLPGMPFPGRTFGFPTKDEAADYLQAYAAKFKLPVRCGTRVNKLSKSGDGFILDTPNTTYEASNVVVAMGSYQVPRVPEFASSLDPGIFQVHSAQYRSPKQFKPGPVLVVGAANSGAEIALDAVGAGHETYLAGRHPGHVPVNINGFAAKLFFLRLIKFAGNHILTVNKKPGQKMRAKLLSGGAPVVRAKPKIVDGAGVKRLPRVTGVKDGRPVCEGVEMPEVSNVVWCTGFAPGFNWIDLDIFDEHAHPVHSRGIVEKVPGLYFVGLLYIYAMSSGFLLGVGRDAGYVVGHIAERSKQAAPRLQGAAAAVSR
jgi:putative flavoprotein involved in K+ transport